MISYLNKNLNDENTGPSLIIPEDGMCSFSLQSVNFDKNKSNFLVVTQVCNVGILLTLDTVDEEHALLLFLRRSENSDWILQWWSLGKYILKHK